MPDTLEQIDVARNLMHKYHDVFEFATTAAGAERAIKNGKVASFMGIEGAHQLGNSLAGELAFFLQSLPKCYGSTMPSACGTRL